MKSSYIDELETALFKNHKAFRRKNSFYQKALIFGLLSVAPFLICLGFHISKNEQREKVQIVKSQIDIKSHKIDNMAKSKDEDEEYFSGPIPKPGINTRLPGVDSSKVLPSLPVIIREGSSKPEKKKFKEYIPPKQHSEKGSQD